ncbi:PLDc N-terminal domain-containing protein [Paenibacillus sp. FSL H3-0333]|uniref:PLDc N-terminal domain-containing protein n=1 Tax=Paenibacillus sp. FSL H3-0333 TaxID=2921373 RepID=UPI0030F83AF8
MKVHLTVEQFVFWALTATILLSCIALGYAISPYMGEFLEENLTWLIVISLLALLFLGLNVLIAVFIYKDASRRRMNAWLWVTAVIYIPNFIGLILYLLARKQHHIHIASNAGNEGIRCPHCGHLI